MAQRNTKYRALATQATFAGRVNSLLVSAFSWDADNKINLEYYHTHLNCLPTFSFVKQNLLFKATMCRFLKID